MKGNDYLQQFALPNFYFFEQRRTTSCVIAACRSENGIFSARSTGSRALRGFRYCNTTCACLLWVIGCRDERSPPRPLYRRKLPRRLPIVASAKGPGINARASQHYC